MSQRQTLHLDGIALWAPRLTDWNLARSILRGECSAASSDAPRPAPTLLAPTERRRAPDTVAIALHVAQLACDQAQRESQQLRSVFASTHGDLAINDYMCSTLASTPLLISPTRFHNSVHNAAAGYWTIGTGSTTAATALTAFEFTFAQGLLEAAIQTACDGEPNLLVAYDIAARGALASVTDCDSMFGLAMVLSPEPSAHSLAQISWCIEPGQAAGLNAHEVALASGFAMQGNPLRTCLPLLTTLAKGQDAALELALAQNLLLKLAVSFPQ